jgi:hypothetical protein
MAATFKLAGYAPNGTDTRTTVGTSIIEPATICGTPDDETTHYLISVQTNPVMVTFDGSDPTASNGHLYAAGYGDFWTKQMAIKARWIRQGASDAAVQATPFCYV